MRFISMMPTNAPHTFIQRCCQATLGFVLNNMTIGALHYDGALDDLAKARLVARSRSPTSVFMLTCCYAHFYRC
jgi:hypothetical protein